MNKFIFNGRLVRNPEVKFTQTNNTKITAITIAVRRNYKSSNGEYDSDFFNLTSFGSIADLLEKHFKKGQEILVSGHIQNRNWDDDAGTKHYATDYVVETVDFIGSKVQKEEESNVNQAELEVNISDNSGDDLPF